MSGVSYATLAQLREEVKGTVTTEDAILLRAGRFMTAAVDEYVSSRVRPTTFAPRRVTHYYDADRYGAHIYDHGRGLYLDRPFVAFTSVADGYNDTLTASVDYYTTPRVDTPYTALYRFDEGGYWWDYDTTAPYYSAIAITGDWCYRKFYSEAWAETTTLGAALTDTTGTALTVASGSLLSPGQMLRVDSEWLSIESGSGTSWVVNRGERGSTAATHLIGATVYRFIPEPVITRAVMRWAGLAFARRGSFESTRFDGTETVQFPEAMPKEVRELLDHGGWMQRRGALV
jgi:hypothetical protein